LKVAVTGASGFIGKYLLRELIKEQYEVIALSRDTSKLSDFAGKIKVKKLDLKNLPSNIYKKLDCPDLLIHLAWGGLPNYNSIHHFECELPQQYCFLKEMIKSGLKKLIVSGSCLEYGLKEGCMKEEMLTNPVTPYAFAKDTLRKQLFLLKKYLRFNVKITWLRIFYLYGDGQSKHSLYSQFVHSVRENYDSFKMSKGDQKRDYLPVEKAATYISSLASINNLPEILNICSGKPISLLQLVNSWKRKLKAKVKLETGVYPYPEYEPFAFWGDNKLLLSLMKKLKKG